MLEIVPAFARIGEENAFAVLARATELARQGRDIINLGIGQPDFQTPPHIVEKVAKLRAVADAHGIPLGAAALQFCVAHPVVCTVLTGPKSLPELDGILKWWNTAIPAGFWDALADQKLVAPGTPLPNGRVAG